MSTELWFGIVSLAVGSVGAMFSILASVIAYFVKRGEDVQDKNIEALHIENRDIKSELDGVRRTLASYESYVGAGEKRLQEIKAEIADHVRKEEQIFWKKVDAIAEAHKLFAEAVLQRIASMEAKMPNGEIQEIVKALARLEANALLATAAAKSAQDHVEEHNAEAEDWKRRIVALEAGRGLKDAKRGTVRGAK